MTSPVFSPPILTHRPHRCNNLYANLYVFLSGKVFQEPHMRGLAPGNLSKIHRTSPKSNHWQMEPIRPGHSRPLPIQHSAFGIARCAPPDRPFRGPRSRFCPSPLARPGGPRFVAAARKARPWRVLSRPIGPARTKPGPPDLTLRPPLFDPPGATVFFLVVDFSCFVGFWRLEVVEEKKVAKGAFSLGEGRPH